MEVSYWILIEKKHDTTNPITYPIDQATGGFEYPRATFVSSVSSAIILLTAPMCPFIAPCKHRLWSSGEYIAPEVVDRKSTSRQAPRMNAISQTGESRELCRKGRPEEQACARRGPTGDSTGMRWKPQQRNEETPIMVV